MKKLLYLLPLLVLTQGVYAFDVVYPKKNIVTINSPTTFFVGSSDKPLTINEKKVDIHPSGGFAYFVDLNEGQNTFELKTEDEVQKFIITRPKKISGEFKEPQVTEYKELKNLEVTTDNAPLRSTPVDGGINRLAHLQPAVQLQATGEKAGFYRVKLGDEKAGWISKSDVKASSTKIEQGNFLDYVAINDKEFYIYVFHLDRRVPFEITEGETFTLKFYNMKNCEKSVYTFEFPYTTLSGTKKIVGYSGYYDGNNFIFKVRKYPKVSQYRPLRGVKITIDPGHGGKENGAVGCLGDKEKDVVLSISKLLEKELKHRGAKVYMTRSDDTYVGLRDRVDFANDNDSMFLISIHGNALPDTMNPLEHKGTSIYYYYPQAKLLAANVLVSMNETAGTSNDKVRQQSYALARNTDAVSILVETAYLINPDDNAKLIDEAFQINCAKAIADGIANYLK